MKGGVLYRHLKHAEHTMESAIMAVPLKDTPEFVALELNQDDAWKLDAAHSYLIWFRDRLKRATNRVYIADGAADNPDPEVEGDAT